MEPALKFLPSGLMLARALGDAYPKEIPATTSACLIDDPEMVGFLKTHGLRSDLRITHKKGQIGFLPVGSNFQAGNNPPFIILERKLLALEPAGCRFFFKKSCYQIKRNTPFYTNLIMTINCIVMALLMNQTTFGGGFSRGLIHVFGCVLLYALLNDIYNSAARDFALNKSTDSELVGALNILAGIDKFNNAPPCSLISYIHKELTLRNVEIPPLDEQVIQQHAELYIRY